jgi:hypothetical protein
VKQDRWVHDKHLWGDIGNLSALRNHINLEIEQEITEWDEDS